MTIPPIPTCHGVARRLRTSGRAHTPDGLAHCGARCVSAQCRAGATVSPAALLSRPEQPVYGPEATRLVAGRRVLVTGAGGSIGTEIVRQLLRLGAGEITSVDNDEYALYRLQRDLTGSALLEDDHLVLTDVTNPDQLDRVFRTTRPEIVYHAAAHKHLPLLERSPDAAVTTNVLGTAIVVRACAEHRVQRLINISTDKAASPSSVLGMSKRLAELAVAAHAERLTVASVRFGNVLGSRGSFLETLAYQVQHGLPVSITHPEVTRYFMTIPEAAGLVIEASVLARSGETFVLDMGEPVAIADLVTDYTTLAGVPRPEIRFTGLRPGEKLHEDLVDTSETRRLTDHERIFSVHPDAAGSLAPSDLDWLQTSLAGGPGPQQVRAALQKVLDSMHTNLVV